jgi:hypothetical protein
MERSIASGGGDLQTREKLISYYHYNATPEKMAPHIEWVIERNPDSQLAGIAPMYATYPQVSDSHLQRKRELGMRQIAIHPREPRVLANAAKFLASVDATTALMLLKRTTELEPQNAEWFSQLVNMYVAAILVGAYNDAGLSETHVTMPVNPAFSSEVRRDLDSSTNPAVVGSVGFALASYVTQSYEIRKEQAKVDQARRFISDYAQVLLQRAQALEPTNRQWAFPESPKPVRPTTISPAPQALTVAGVQRIRVGGAAQEGKLLEGAQPVYPPLAQQARVQGTVRFQVVIGQDGHIANITVLAGHPLLVPAALEAVKTRVYQADVAQWSASGGRNDGRRKLHSLGEPRLHRSEFQWYCVPVIADWLI